MESWPGRDAAQLLLCSCLLSPLPAMTETREPAETGGYASLEEDDEDLSPGPEHSSDSEYTLSEPDSEEEEDEEEEEEETTDDPEYDPGYKVKQRLGGGRGGPSRRAPRAAQPPGPPAQPCQLCGRSPLGEAPPGTPPCRLCCPATAPRKHQPLKAGHSGRKRRNHLGLGRADQLGGRRRRKRRRREPTTVRNARIPSTTWGSCTGTSCCMPGVRCRQSPHTGSLTEGVGWEEGPEEIRVVTVVMGDGILPVCVVLEVDV